MDTKYIGQRSTRQSRFRNVLHRFEKYIIVLYNKIIKLYYYK